MPYATEVEYRAALAAYRALHKVFYRFYASVRAQHPGTWADQLPAAAFIFSFKSRLKQRSSGRLPALSASR